MKEKILFIDNPHVDMQTQLEDLGYECVRRTVSYGELLQTANQYVGYVIRSRFAVDKTLIDASSQLRFIARIGAGMENIDTEYANSKGIACLNSPEGNADAVGEYVIGALLSLFRNTKDADNQVRNGFWLREENRGMEICGKTFGIIGYGNMGKSLAKKLSGLGCTILVHDKFKQNFQEPYFLEVDLQTLQLHADIVSIHINYTEENHYFVNHDFIQAFAKEIYLVNTARGKVLSTEDLAKNLLNGKVKGAILDVLEYEDIRLQNKPFEEWDRAMHILAQSDDVILSPHIAGQTFESLTKHVKILVEKIKNCK
ncbi:MAG: NAD(P)-binding domain-containing protein [Lentimicrobiaceae bacterium]|nr:NAD(P)-binding domain-containing protein [Lentimicrobiaceae bacterium]